MSDKIYNLSFSKEEIAYLISLLGNLSPALEKIPDKKIRTQNKFYFNCILDKLDKVRK